MADAGWYRDPTNHHEHRYWDGSIWTEHVADRGTSGTDLLTVLSLPPPSESVSMHAGLKLSFVDTYRLQRREDLVDQMPEVESQDAAYQRWVAATVDPQIVEMVTARYREGLRLENEVLGRARVRSKLKGLREVGERYESLLAERPEFANAACRLAYVQDAVQNMHASVEAARRACVADPRFEMPYFLAGVALKKLGRLQEAEDCYRGALAVNEQFAAARNNLGLVLVDKRDFEGAAEQFRTVLEHFPTARNALDNLAMAEAKIGRK